MLRASCEDNDIGKNWLRPAPVISLAMFSVLTETVQVIREHFPIASEEAVIRNDSLKRVNNVIQIPIVKTAPCCVVLEFIQLLLSSG